MIKKFTKCCVFVLILLFSLMMTQVFAAEGEETTYEAKIIIYGTDIEYNFETVEEAFSAIEAKESENIGKGYILLQLLKDVEVDTTLVAKTKQTNVQIEMNGCSITSSADPVMEIKVPISGITNEKETPCSIIQKNVSTVSETSPNTIIYAPTGAMALNINATNVTFGDGTGTAVNSSAMMPYGIGDGIFLGKMILNKYGVYPSIVGGLFSEDPTPYIDTNAYVALKNDEGLYYLETFHAATVDPTSGDIIKKYGLAQDAIDAAEVGGRVEVLKQYYPPKTVVISSDDILTFDLAGFQFTGVAAPNSAIVVKGDSLIQNKGKLSIVDIYDADEDPGALNFVSSENYEGEVFCTILNQGELALNDINVSVNYNQPNYKGNIYTLCNDSSNSDAIIYIDSASKVCGLKLEPEEPTTEDDGLLLDPEVGAVGKYPAIMTKGNHDYKNEVHIGYVGSDGQENTEDDDTVTYYVENSVIGEVEDVFDADGNYTTTFYLNNGKDLQKRNISVKKDGVELEFEYDSETNTLTIPAVNFTDDADSIEIRLKHEVTYIADGETVEVLYVIHGEDATAPEVPEKEGYTGEWDKDGKKIIEDTTITAIYTEFPQDNEDEEQIEEEKNDEDDKKEEGTEEELDENGNVNNAEREDEKEETDLIDTGDNSNIELWTTLLVVSIAVLMISVRYACKTKYKARH